MLKYDAHHYDDFLKLKISASLWFFLLYGVRHFFFVAALKLMPNDVGSIDWINAQANLLFMITDIPAAIVLLAIGHRLPDAFAIIRWVWAHGKIVLISSYLFSIALFIYLNQALIQGGDIDKLFLAAAVLIPDVLIIGLIIKSELIKDIFSEFPAPKNKD